MIRQTDQTGIKIDLTGVKEVEMALKNLDNKTSRVILLKALRKATTPFIKTAKQLAYPASEPYIISGGKFKGYKLTPGRLRKSIGYKALSKYPPVVYIGPTRGAGKKQDAYYAHWIEWGRDAYEDKTIPRPYMRPAWDMNKAGAIQTIRDYLRDELMRMGKWQ